MLDLEFWCTIPPGTHDINFHNNIILGIRETDETL